MKSDIKRILLWVALGIFTFFVFTLSVNAQENKTKKVIKKEGMEEAKKLQRVYKISPNYEDTKAINSTKSKDNKKKKELKKVNRVYKISPDYESTSKPIKSKDNKKKVKEKKTPNQIKNKEKLKKKQ